MTTEKRQTSEGMWRTEQKADMGFHDEWRGAAFFSLDIPEQNEL